MFPSLLLGFLILAASVVTTLVTTPLLLAALATRRWRWAGAFSVPWAISLPCTLMLLAFARVYGDPDWRDPPPLESVYEGERARLQLWPDGSFLSEVDGQSLDGTWSTSGPSESLSTTAGLVHLVSPGLEREAVLRWDGKLGLEGQLLHPRD